ncbi:MAG TPA: DUF4402 domain-containing protein [Rubricoccaceae bacterium]|jgi:hypothetical protein
MNRTTLLLGALALLPAAASAQTETGSFAVTASVESVVAFSSPSPLEFGSIVPGTPTTIAPAAGGSIMLSYNVPATVTVSASALTNGVITLPVTYACAQDADAAAEEPTTFTCGTGYAATLVSNAPPTRWFYVGGSIADSGTALAPAGDYAGTVTLTASFDTF